MPQLHGHSVFFLEKPPEPAHKSKSRRIGPKKTRTITANRVRAWKMIADDTHVRNPLINY
jgi:hypothetical protein